MMRGFEPLFAQNGGQMGVCCIYCMCLCYVYLFVALIVQRLSLQTLNLKTRVQISIGAIGIGLPNKVTYPLSQLSWLEHTTVNREVRGSTPLESVCICIWGLLCGITHTAYLWCVLFMGYNPYGIRHIGCCFFMGVQLKWQSARLACERHWDQCPALPTLYHRLLHWYVLCN